MPLVIGIILRYSFGSHNSRFTRLVARASMVGMALGVASLITVMSVMNGFAAELNSRILSLVAHATIQSTEGEIDDWLTLKATLLPEVKGVAPFIEDTVLIQSWGHQRGARLSGIDLNAQRSISRLEHQVTLGKFSVLEQRRFTVALGSVLARTLGVTVGDKVEVALPTLLVTPIGVFPRTRQLEIVAEFDSGSSFNATEAYVSLDTASRLFSRRGVDGVQVRFDNVNEVETRLPQLREKLPESYRIIDWRSTQGSLFTAVKMEKIIVSVLLVAVILVAAFNIVSTLTMSVTEKARDIAVLQVMGLSSRMILLIFMGHGIVLGGTGLVVGILFGILLATNISTLMEWLERVTGSYLFDPQVYYVTRLPSELHWQDVTITVVIALVLSLLATVYPAWRAAHIKPVELLNHV